MSSQAQKLKGYPIPETWITEETASYCIVIPAGEDFRRAAYAQLLLLGKYWNWKRDEGDPDSTRAKNTAETWRLLFEFNEECGMSIDYDALKQAISEGMYEFGNNIAKQIVSGRTNNISVDEDGTVSDPTTGEPAGEDLPPDDPTTPIDEKESAIYGGATEILRAIEKLLDRLDTIYGSVNGTPLVPVATAQEQIKLMFPSDTALMDAAVSEYYAYRATENIIQFTPTNNDFLNFYCLGYDLFAWNNWLLQYSGFNNYKISTCAEIVAALAPAFWNKYFNTGSEKPSNAYLDASCVPMPYQEYLNVPYASTRTLLPSIAKGGHRLLIQVSGYYVDPDGDLQDAFWYRTAAGVLARSNFTFSHGAGSNMPSDNQVVYNAAHVYEYTIDLFNGASSWSVTFNRNANMNVASTSPTSGFTIKITDLGAYTV